MKSAIALGSNQGDSQAILEAALQVLTRIDGITLERCSHWYRTKAVGPPQPDYLNGCAVLAVTVSPWQLMEILLQVESQFGRVRRERNGPRTLDLDLLLFDDLILDTPSLQVPHPRMHHRAFVLVPLAQVAADWVEPITGKTIAELLQGIDQSGIRPVAEPC